MNEAELFVEVKRRSYPTIYGTREKTLEHILVCNGTGYQWHNGRIVQSCKPITDNKNESLIQQQILNGELTFDDYLWKAHLEHAQHCYEEDQKIYHKILNEHPEYTETDKLETKKVFGRSLEEIAQSFLIKWKYSVAVPCVYNSIYELYCNICNIPDDVTPDWLNICIETLHYMLQAKIDFNERTIIPEDEIKHFFPDKPINKEVETIADEIVDRVASTVLNSKKLQTEEKKRKSQEEWERLYSPKARAKFANEHNVQARKLALRILESLKLRNFNVKI